MRTLAVIPARWASTRLPGKPLRDLGGKPLVVRVLEAVRSCDGLDRVVVATDDQRIASAVEAAEGEAVLTSSEHVSGTDRIAEVLGTVPADWVVNVQGDEPFLPARALQALLDGGRRSPDEVGTLFEPIASEDEWLDPSVVKAVRGEDGRALYFSRAPVPAWRPGTAPSRPWEEALRHVGVYSCSREALLRWAAAPPSPLERREGLEQLRLLEAGVDMRLYECPERTLGVDTEEHLEQARRRWREERAS